MTVDGEGGRAGIVITDKTTQPKIAVIYISGTPNDASNTTLPIQAPPSMNQYTLLYPGLPSSVVVPQGRPHVIDGDMSYSPNYYIGAGNAEGADHQTAGLERENALLEVAKTVITQAAKDIDNKDSIYALGCSAGGEVLPALAYQMDKNALRAIIVTSSNLSCVPFQLSNAPLRQIDTACTPHSSDFVIIGTFNKFTGAEWRSTAGTDLGGALKNNPGGIIQWSPHTVYSAWMRDVAEKKGWAPEGWVGGDFVLNGEVLTFQPPKLSDLVEIIHGDVYTKANRIYLTFIPSKLYNSIRIYFCFYCRRVKTFTNYVFC